MKSVIGRSKITIGCFQFAPECEIMCSTLPIYLQGLRMTIQTPYWLSCRITGYVLVGLEGGGG